MSIDLVALCWKKKFDNHADRDVMVALCDHANDDGVCWPSRAHIAWKMDRHPETVKACLKKFRLLGLIETRREANNDLSKSPVVRVLPHKLKDKPLRETGGRETPRGEGAQDPPGGGVSDPPDRGAVDPPKPSGEPPVEPSVSPRGADAPKEKKEDPPAKAMTTMTIDRARLRGFYPSSGQIANWGSGWAKYIYVSEDEEPPSADEQLDVLDAIVDAAAGKAGKTRYFLAVGDAVTRVREGNVTRLDSRRPDKPKNVTYDDEGNMYINGILEA